MALTLNCDKCNAEPGDIESYWKPSYLRTFAGPVLRLPKGWDRRGRAGRPIYLCPKCVSKEESRIQQQDLAEETL